MFLVSFVQNLTLKFPLDKGIYHNNLKFSDRYVFANSAYAVQTPPEQSDQGFQCLQYHSASFEFIKS